MKSNKTLKYTGIIQGVLIATLLLLAIWIQVTFLYNYYCEDSSFWAIHGDYPVLFIFNTLFTTFASFSSLSGNYVLYVIFEIMDIASLVLPVYLVYKSIRSKKHDGKRLDYYIICCYFYDYGCLRSLYPS